MCLSGTEVAVKTTTLKEYSYHNILHEAKVLAEVCRGHPNLPLFIGVYDHKEHPKPLLVMKFYSVAGESYSLHRCLRDECKTPEYSGWEYLQHRQFFAGRGSLSFLLNTDGVSLFCSSNISLWPIWLAVNELPPHVRCVHIHVYMYTFNNHAS